MAVTDSELVARLREFLRTADLNTTTIAVVRRQLEKDFAVDLSDRKAFLRNQIDLFLRTHVEETQNDDVKEEMGKEDVDPEELNVVVKNKDGGGGNEREDDDPIEEVEEEEEEEDDDYDYDSLHKEAFVCLLEEEDKDVKKRGGGFSKPCALSPKLQEFVGVSELARTKVVKKVWAYIRERNLQDPQNKRKILCDETLHDLFRVKSIDMFKMNKALTKHIWPIEDCVPPVKSSGKGRQRKRGKEGSNESKLKAKRQKGEGSGLLAPLPLSDALVKFIGTGENALSRADVVKKIWQYIKENNLQDPSDKRRIICDDKLKVLFNVDTFIGFTVSKLLKAHFIKAE